MNPIYENIDVAINTSIKVATYHHSKKCPTSNWHIHPEYELVFVKNGSGDLRIGTKMERYSDGLLLFLGPNIPHADFGNKDQTDNLEVVLQFGSDFIEEKLVVFPEFKAIRTLLNDSKSVLLFDAGIHKQLSENFERFEAGNPAQRLILLLTILETLSQCHSPKRILGLAHLNSFKTSDVKRLETVFELVNQNYGRLLTTKTMAAHLGLTTNSFCRFFKRMTNKNFIQFVNEFRVRKATELFNEASLSVSEVLYQCGFNDASYFTKQFKKYQGVTPSNYLSVAV